jgi:hypothetical protein
VPMDRVGQRLAAPGQTQMSPLGDLQESLCEWLIQSPRVTRLIADIAQDVNGSSGRLDPSVAQWACTYSVWVCAASIAPQVGSQQVRLHRWATCMLQRAVFSCGVAGGTL